MPLGLEELRERTLANNLVWLRSFGCRVRRLGGVVFVTHPDLNDYCALLLFADPKSSYTTLEAYAGHRPRRASAPNVYVDREAYSPELRQLLSRNGCARKSVSQVTAGEWARAGRAGEVEIRAALTWEVADWASVYSLGFGREGADKESDRRRWGMSFQDPAVGHWFFLRRGKVIGVCQTCDADGVVGIYSFTLVPEEREFDSVHSAVNALRAKLLEDGPARVYFERVKGPENSRPFRRLAGALSGFKVIRVSEAYRCDGFDKDAPADRRAF
ncbi:MAG TPA: hypothetical protein VJ866_14610 [Pyrinomonadaceae bacterium]|nr:hypothetical protein [Pyrinomonadaceae bacterium]